MQKLRIDGISGGEAATYQLAKILAPLLRLDLTRTRSLLAVLPTVLPLQFDAAECEALTSSLREAGAMVTVFDMPQGTPPHCSEHPHFIAAAACPDCAAEICVVCEREGRTKCRPCLARGQKRRRNQSIRVGVLLLILSVVLLLGWREVRRRSVDWSAPQRIAVVLLTSEQGLSAAVTEAFQKRALAVETAVGEQAQRYGARHDAIQLVVHGPTVELRAPPSDPGTGILELFRFNRALSSYADIHDEALGLKSNQFDVRIYVRARDSDGAREMVEGIGQQFGQVGLVSVEMSEAGIDFAWFVVLHEFFHTRGASDKYDSHGLSRVPEGMADPAQEPLYPQPGTEVMARGRPLSHADEDIPGAPETWAVGAWTAREIKWTTPD